MELRFHLHRARYRTCNLSRFVSQTSPDLFSTKADVSMAEPPEFPRMVPCNVGGGPETVEIPEELLDETMKRLGAEVAAALVSVPNRKQQRIAFEKYVTRCLIERLSGSTSTEHEHMVRVAELQNDPFAALYAGADGGAGPADTSPACALVDDPVTLLAQRGVLLSEVRARRGHCAEGAEPAATDAELLSALNAADDPAFHQIAQLTQRAIEARKRLTATVWSAWPRGSWASVCDDRLLGPFPSFDAAYTEIKSQPRSGFGAASWQVGVTPTPLCL